MANVTISEIPGGEDTSPANTSEIEIKVGGVSKFAQLVNILKNAIPIGGTTPAPGAFTTLKQTTGKAARWYLYIYNFCKYWRNCVCNQ